MRNFLFCCAMLAATSASAQDVLITQNGDVMNVYDVEVGPSTVFYKNENKTNAPTLRMSKSDVIMIKRKDGTKYDLGNGVQTQAQQTQVQQPATSVQATVSDASRKRNEAIIDHANNFNPEYVGDDTKKNCDRVLCIMGIGDGSQLVNDDIEITPVLGCINTWWVKGEREKAISKEGKIVPESGADFDEFEISDKMHMSYVNPAFQLRVKNKTNKTLYVDLGNTFISRNDVATAYYVPSSTSSSSSSSSGASVNLGAVAGALGVGGALGTLANGIGVGGGSTSGTVNTTYSQRVIAVPPMSVKQLDAMLLFEKYGKICDGLFISGNAYFHPYFSFATKADGDYLNGETHDFIEATSPLKFGFFVAYSDNETCQNERNLSFNYYLRRMIGFGKKKGLSDYFDTSVTCNKLGEVIPDVDKCTFFVGRVCEGKAKPYGLGHTVFKRGDK